MIKPAIKYYWGLGPKRVQWIWKQIILPRLTYGCHVWGHSLTQYQKSLIKKVERLTLIYYAPMLKSTSTASLQVILNQKPSHIEVKGVGIKSYICIKNQFQNNFWNGIPYNKRLSSHLLTLQNLTNEIIHEGEPLGNFLSDYMREPFFSWNPPTCNTLTAVCEDDIDDEYDMDEHVTLTQNDDNDSFDEENSQAVVDASRPDGEVPQVIVGINGVNINGHNLNIHDVNNCYNDLGSIPRIMVAQNGNKGSAGEVPGSLEVVSPINELILKQFTNNYH